VRKTCRGRQLITLKDAANYITRLPKAEHESPQWQAAIEALIMAAVDRAPLMHARRLREFGIPSLKAALSGEA